MDHVFQALQYVFRRVILAAGRVQKGGQHSIELAVAVRLQRPNVESTTAAQLEPTLFQKIVIGGADGVGMNLVAARDGADARQFVAGRQIVAQNPKQDLAHQLLANRKLAVLGDPESHVALSQNNS